MYDPVEAWVDGSCEPSGVSRKSFKDGAAFEFSFLAVNALANLGGHAAAGKPERDFSFGAMPTQRCVQARRRGP